jgi:endonuclease/exonuclease/phosphatase family metal-dependent hydrolase
MSFNIRYGKADDGANHWQHRKTLVVDTISSFDPDLLGTQETMKFQAEFLQQALPDFGYVGTSRVPEDEEEEQCALFFRASRFEELESGHFWLSETPDNPGSKSWDSALPRMVTWVKLRDRQDPPRPFYWLNTHFDHRGREARLQSSALIRTRLQRMAQGTASILTGDFNSGEASLPYQVLLYRTRALHLVDTFRSVHPQPDPRGEATFSGWRGNRRGDRIDWIMATDHWRTLEAAITYTNDQGRYPSDHYPVTAVLERID